MPNIFPPHYAKVYERAAHSQFVHLLDHNEKISKLQSGNRRLHSTETALLYFTDDILKNMDDKLVSVIVLLDMSKAFDSISQDLMLSKLQSIGVSNAAWDWFGSYLPVLVEVSQGSIHKLPSRACRRTTRLNSWPVLFSLYVNDLLSVPTHCHAMGYVDDTKIFLSLPPNQISEAVIALNEDILAIARWCCTNSPFITLIRLSSRLSEFRRLRAAYHLFRRLNYWAKKLNLYLWPRIWV